jgi:hypothetical protein
MLKEEDTYYLCRVPTFCIPPSEVEPRGYDHIVIVSHPSYNYQRAHERALRQSDPNSTWVLLAQGSEREMRMYRQLMKD